jgi:hypothetical protein
MFNNNLFVCDLINDATSNSKCTASKDNKIVNNDLETSEGRGHYVFTAQSQDLPAGIDVDNCLLGSR